MAGVFIRRSYEDRERDTHKEGKRPCEDGGTYWSDIATGQGTPRIVRGQGEARKDSSLEP